MSQPIIPPGPIGFIGLGNRGQPMARRLLGAGYRLRLFDRSEKALAAFKNDDGATAAPSPAALAAEVDAVITMLPDGKSVAQSVLGSGGLAGALRTGAIVIDMSSSDPVGTRELGATLPQRGFGLVAAP